MRPDPHAGKTPGLGCGCKLCQQPLPEVTPPNALEAAMRSHYFENGRAGVVQPRIEPDASVAFETEPT